MVVARFFIPGNGSHRRFAELIANRRRHCELEISKDGTMLYFPGRIYSAHEIPALISEFETLIFEIKCLSEQHDDF